MTDLKIELSSSSPQDSTTQKSQDSTRRRKVIGKSLFPDKPKVWTREEQEQWLKEVSEGRCVFVEL